MLRVCWIISCKLMVALRLEPECEHQMQIS